jgi:predicted dehydrogenase
MANFPVWGLYNRTRQRAGELAEEYSVSHVFDDLDEALAAAPDDVIFDLALPASFFASVLSKLPRRSHVLIQKPMGETIGQAMEILEVCRERELQAAINCQLRFAPFVLAARSLIERGVIGELLDMEMRLNTYTPWNLFPFLNGIPRVEIVYHSVHYVDLIRSFLGQPRSILARTYPHPGNPQISSERTSMILDYPDPVRALITTNHTHRFGRKHQESYLKWEGTKGAIRADIGLLLDYPQGARDAFAYCILEDGKDPKWENFDIEGSWFPHAFVGSMAQVMRHKEGSLERMPSSVEDVFHTMTCVEAAYVSNSERGIEPGRFNNGVSPLAQ